jgi:DNA-binding MarR family transcriptional regulator
MQDLDYPACAATLRRQVSLFVRRLRRESGTSGLSIAQLTLLASIERLGPSANPSELAESDGLRPSNLSAMLTDLDEQGLIVRRRASDDKRKVTVSLTRQGKGVLESDRGERESWLAEALEHQLSRSDAQLLVRAGALLERLAYCEQDAGE